MTVSINNQDIKVPQSWNELPLKKQIECYAILLTDTRNLLLPQELIPAKKIMLIQSLLDLDDEFMKAWKQDCLDVHAEHGETIFLSELNELLQIANFLFEPTPDGGYSVHLGLTKCPFPELERKKKNKKIKRLFAPDDDLRNISLYELGMTFTHFERYLKTKDAQHIDTLIATLYRPPKHPTKANKESGYQGDIRLPLLNHESMVKKRIKRIQQLPNPVKQLIVFWFASCRQKTIDKYTNVFVTPSGEKGGNDYGWATVIFALAGSLKDMQSTSQESAKNALTYLSYLEDERQKAETKAKKRA